MMETKTNQDAATQQKPPKSTPVNRWSARVTRESSALALEEGVFTWDDPERIARSLKRSADSSENRKTPPFRSAMSMLVFYTTGRAKTWMKTVWKY